ARRGDEALFDAIAARLATAKTPAERSAYLGALGAFRAAPSRRKALALSLEAGLRPNEMFTIPFGGFDTATGRDETYTWFTSNYDAIASRMPPLYLPFLVGIAGGCEEERVVAARAFFLDPKRKVEGMEKRLEQTEQQVKDCVGLRKREGNRVAEYLGNQQ
ncbi:MAG: ERAP1-like C-terminal domain-containing protein, partial [Acidobacteria bacterium]|nr:ERAP1-like C-terminal domain-containing protein [Acidobacteriota bacterium]